MFQLLGWGSQVGEKEKGRKKNRERRWREQEVSIRGDKPEDVAKRSAFQDRLMKQK